MNDLAGDLRAFWPGDRLQQAPPAAVDPLMIPKSSKAFLMEVGLPVQEIAVTRFELKRDRFPTLTELAKAKSLPPPSGSDCYRLIGRGIDAPDMFIDESANGAVIEISLDPSWKRFVNSSVEQLGTFLL